jgi:1,4-dihydroxy-2-naphthoate octaprenyltransferase
LGIADVVFFLMFGVVAVAGMYYVQAHTLPLSAFVLGLPAGAIVTNVLLIDDIRDRDFDALKGWRTGTVRFGRAWTRLEFAGLMAFAYALPFWFWLGLGYRAWVLLPLLTLPPAVRITRTVWTCARFEELFPMTPRTAGLALTYAVLLGIGIAVR